MVRFYTPNFDEACDALDLYDIDYDLDIKAPLKKGGYNFEERKEFWDSFFDFKAPKLRLPVEITKPSGKDGIAQ